MEMIETYNILSTSDQNASDADTVEKWQPYYQLL